MNETNLDYQLVTADGWESSHICVELGVGDCRCIKQSEHKDLAFRKLNTYFASKTNSCGNI